MDNKPLVSIGLPVYNGEDFLEDAVDSILEQTYENIELIIADNCSTDRTAEICRHYCNQDTRISYYRHSSNLGAAPNFNFVVYQAKGKYFKWAAHDDILNNQYLEECVCFLENNPSYVLCGTDHEIIDEHGKIIDLYEYKIQSFSPHLSRFYELIKTRHWAQIVFGVVPLTVLKKTNLIQKYAGSDRVLLANLALFGNIGVLPQKLFFSRDHSKRSIRALNARQRAKWFDTKAQENIVLFPRANVFVNYWKILQDINLSTRIRLQYRALVVRAALWNVPYFVYDFLVGVIPKVCDLLQISIFSKNRSANS